MSWQAEVDEILERRRLAKQQGGPAALERQHVKGRLSLRERITALADPGSFQETGPISGGVEYDDEGQRTEFTPANFILGTARIGGRTCVVGGEDFTVKGGSPNAAGLRKSIYAETLALTYKLPLVRLHEGGGGSVAGSKGKGASGPVGDPVFYPPRFQSVAKTLSTVPVVSAALGPVAGLPAARLAASHFTVMTEETAQVLIAGPAVVKRALDEDVTKESLGGPTVHLTNGVVDNGAKDEADAFRQIARFLDYLPNNCWELPERRQPDDSPDRREEALLKIIPRDRRRIFNMRKLIQMVVDQDSFFEMRRQYGPGLITGLARMHGRPIALFANDTRFYAGAMTAEGADKVRKLIQFAETFHLPVITFIDEPGFMIGSASEKAGTIRLGTAAVLAAANCSVPWASVLVRKNFGVAAAAHYAPDGLVLTWPSAEMGALPVEGGVAVAFARDIAAADDPEARRLELENELARKQSAFPRSESFAVHDLIDPRETRPTLCRWIDLLDARLEAHRGPVRFGMLP